MGECKAKDDQTDATHELVWTGTAQRVANGLNKYEHKCKLCGQTVWLEYVYGN